MTTALLLAGVPEGYGVGLEPLVYLSFLLPALLLAFIWWLGRNTV
jgi:hypothetical protein